MKRCYAAGLVLAFALAGCSSATISGTGAGRPHQGPTAVVTTADAKQVLTQYTAGLNQALRAGETSVLARYVGGASYPIRVTAFKDPTIKQTPAQTFSQPRFAIPFQTTYPAWFAVRVHQQASGTGQDDYLVFTKAAAGAPWLEVFEPVVIAKTPQPTIATDKNGNAVAIPGTQAGQLAVAPDALPAAQAKYLDPVTPAAGGGRPCPPGTSKALAAKLGCTPAAPTTAATGSGTVTFSDGSDIVDLHDRSVFTSHGSGEIAITNRHGVTTDPVYALRTTDGGALVFYDLSASMVLSPAGGFAGLFSIDYPDLITKGKNQDASFQVNYREEFAVDEPQGTPAKPTVVAQFGGATSASCGGGPCH
jgi:hypothetical protein